MGRERALDMLLASLEDATSGRGQLVLMGGEPGIGKTRIAEEFAAMAARRGARVLWGRSWEAGGAPAYWPWIQALRGLVAELSPEALDRALAGDRRLVQVLPELGEHLPGLAERSGSSDFERFELFVAISEALRRASQDAPLVVILEDLHAADEPSQLLLRFVATGVSTHHTVLLATYRDIELTKTHPLTALLPELLRAPGASRLAMTGLSEPEVARLIEAITGLNPTRRLVEAIYRQTEGNPLFVGEFIRLLEAEGRLTNDAADAPLRVPEGVRDVIGRRLDRLSAACRDILTIGSVVGRDFDIGLVETVTGESADELLEALQEAVAARLIAEVRDLPGVHRFSHSLVRETVYEELGTTERRRLHAAVARSIERSHVTDRERYVAELAHHFFEAGPSGDAAKVVEYATEAAHLSMRALAYEETVRLCRMALRDLDESPDERRRCDVLVVMGNAQARAGDQPGSKETFLAAAAIATRLGEPDALAKTALGYAGRFAWARAGMDVHLVPMLRQALDALPREDSVLRARLLARLAGALRDQHAIGPRTKAGEEAVAIARRLGDPETLVYALLGWWGAALLGPDGVDAQLALADELDELAPLIADRELRTNAVWVRYIASLTRGDMFEARRQHHLVDERAGELHQPAQHWYVGVWATVIALQDGRFDEAEELIERTASLGRAQSWDADAARLMALFVLRREQDRVAELEEELRRALTTHPPYRSVRCMLVLLLTDSGRINEARSLFEQLVRDECAFFPKDNEWLYAMALLGEAAAALDDSDRARMIYDLLMPYCDHVVLAASEVSIGPVRRILGVLAGALGDTDAAAAHFDAAVQLCERMGALPWTAHTEAAYAAVLSSRGAPGDRDKAALLVASAREKAAALGMKWLQRRLARAAATERGGRCPEESPLTRRELEVAALVADGMSNREIAKCLYISERTAESHVQNILVKLGFSSRTQVATWVAGERLRTTP